MSLIKIGGNRIEESAVVIDFDADPNLTANSDEAIATQKAVKTYVDSRPAGVSGIDAVLAIGQALTADRKINLNGHGLNIFDGNELDPNGQLEISPDEHEIIAFMKNGVTNSFVNIYADPVGGNVAFQLNTNNGADTVILRGDALTKKITATADNGFSTDSGNNFYKWGGISDGTITATKIIQVTINGTIYDIPAQVD